MSAFELIVSILLASIVILCAATLRFALQALDNIRERLNEIAYWLEMLARKS